MWLLEVLAAVVHSLSLTSYIKSNAQLNLEKTRKTTAARIQHETRVPAIANSQTNNDQSVSPSNTSLLLF